MNSSGILFYNYLKTTMRKMVKQPTYAVINLIGLTVGLVVFLLIFSYVAQEYSYDRKWRDHQQLYRLNASLNFNGRMDHFALSSYNMAQAMKTDFPEVEAATMIFRTSFSDDQTGITVWNEDRMLELPSFTYADEDFFRVFDFPFTEGDPLTALKEPKSLVINTELAKSFFGNEAALGKLLKINKTTYKITGVMDMQQHTTHLQFDALASLSTYPQSTVDQFRRDWFWLLGYTYIRFDNEVSAENFQQKLDLLYENTIKPWIESVNVDGSIGMHIEPVAGIHFNNRLQYDSSTNTDQGLVKIFGLVALFMLLIAAINYMNLATARSMKRAREIGIRKVVGAHRKQLIVQFLSESFLMAALAILIAWALAELLMPSFNILLGMELSLSHLVSGSEPLMPLLLIGTYILLGLLSGFFPAIVLSSFSPVKVLRPGMLTGAAAKSGQVNLRKLLVVLQFIISTGMIISTFVVGAQLHFMQQKPKGFDAEQLMVIHFPSDSTLLANKEVIRQQLLQLPEVKQVAATASLPGYQSGRLMFFVGDTIQPVVHTMNLYVVDHSFFDLLNLQLLEGRLFSKDYPNDATTAFVVNKAAADYLGYADPLSIEMNCGMGVQGKIVGVVENFHYTSLHSPIEPLVFILQNDAHARVDYLAIKLQTQQLSQSIEKVSQIWQQFDRMHHFHYTFLDERFERQYQREQRMLALFGYFSLIIILISCLGLYGLSAFSIEQRSKEIGIRKVLGSSDLSLLRLLTLSFMKLVLLAAILSMPIAYFLLSEWLSGFAFRINLHPLWFVLGVLIAATVAFGTTAIMAWKALNAKPLDSLKYE